MLGTLCRDWGMLGTLGGLGCAYGEIGVCWVPFGVGRVYGYPVEGLGCDGYTRGARVCWVHCEKLGVCMVSCGVAGMCWVPCRVLCREARSVGTWWRGWGMLVTCVGAEVCRVPSGLLGI